MASVQIKARVDDGLWEGLRHPGEKDTELLQRLVANHLAHQERDNRLKVIDPNPDVAIGMLMNSHHMLTLLAGSASLSPPASPPQPKAEAKPAKAKQKSKFDVSAY